MTCYLLTSTSILDWILSPTFILPFFFLKLGMYLYYVNRKNLRFKKMHLQTLSMTDSFQQFQVEKEKEIKNLKHTLKEKDNKLIQYNIDLQQKESVLIEVEQSLNELKHFEGLKHNNYKISPLLHKVKNSRANFALEDAFLNQFKEYYPDFIQAINTSFPSLTFRDIRVCALIKLGKDTKEIANILGIEPLSVDKIKYRLKKKMNLDSSTKLDQFIAQI